jgi:L-fuculose-phosphate aldolase
MVNLHKVKQEICEIGDRLYKKGFAAANDGNISVRVGENQVICTPTLITKGFMKPDDLCLVDMEGNQIGGLRKRTSEVKLHLAIMKERPEIKAVVHCHPPHATAFGIAREPIPQCVLPEVEIFIGDVPISKYAIPGSQEFANTVLPFVHKANVIILANHGTVSYGKDVETAYWWTEILDAYCRILMLAKGLGRITYFTEPEAQSLLQLKEKWGFQDPRAEMENCDICANDVFRDSWKETGVQRTAFQPPSFCNATSAGAETTSGRRAAASANGVPATANREALIQTITDRVMAALLSGGRD